MRSAYYYWWILLLGVFCSILWLLIGDQWKNLADGIHYMKMYKGQIVETPFAYRIMTPQLARLLPLDAKSGFAVVTLTSLVLTAIIISLYVLKITKDRFLSIVSCLLWCTSFAFVYYGTTLVRADAFMYLCLATFFLLVSQKARVVILILVLSAGQLAHETMLICIPVIWIDKITGINIFGTANYTWLKIIIVTISAIFLYFGIRRIIPALPADYNYISSNPYEMAKYVIEYSGGVAKHLMRIYAAYGPVWIYLICYLVYINNRRITFGYALIFIVAFASTFLATDTLRAMSTISIFLIIPTAQFIGIAFNNVKMHGIILIVFQVIYSWIVFGHLQTFEYSAALNTSALIISICTLLFCIYLVLNYKVNHLKSPVPIL